MYCDTCNGRGIVKVGRKYHKCGCVSGTQKQRDAVITLNGIGAKHPNRNAVADKMALYNERHKYEWPN